MSEAAITVEQKVAAVIQRVSLSLGAHPPAHQAQAITKALLAEGLINLRAKIAQPVVEDVRQMSIEDQA